MINFGRVIAHRGASAYLPENTLVAFRKAKELGAQWVECDVRLTRDGQAVIFHDSRLNRTTNGAGWIREKTYEELSKLDAGKGEQIPRLDKLLDMLEEISLSVNLEIKPDFGRVTQTTKKVIEMLHQRSLKNIEVCISSFSQKSLKVVRTLDKNIPMGLAMDSWDACWQVMADKLDCVSVHCSKDILTSERIAQIKATGRLVLAYTVNNRTEAEKLFNLGVDTVFSDYPDLMV